MKLPPNERDTLSALLEKHGVDRDGFNNLRPDAYERVLFSQSNGLPLLDQFYSVLFGQGTLAEQTTKCPRWPAGSPREGNFPSEKTLSNIWARIQKEKLLDRIDPIGEALEKFSQRLAGTSLGRNQILLQAVTGILGEQLMEDALAKQRPDVKLVTALQNQAVIEQNEKKLSQNEVKLAQNNRRIVLLEEAAASAKMKIEAALGQARSKGGLTPETLALMEEAAKLL